MMKNTLILLVTCNLDQSRAYACQKVIENLNEMKDQSFKNDLLVFDNASTIQESVTSLTNNFKYVMQCNKNVGFWSAINWSINNYESIFHKKYEYLYVIESDCLHFENAFERLLDSENFLNERKDIGFVRTEEFSVKNKHLFDKRIQHVNSITYAWVVQNNFIENKPVKFHLDDEDKRIYTCNFLAKVPVLSRMNAMKVIFDKLSKKQSFTEIDYQKFYYELYPKSAILDEGIWNSTFDRNITVNSSWMSNNAEQLGYKPTRNSSIEQIDTKTQISLLKSK